MKIFVGPHEISGIVDSIVKGFQENGVSATGVLSAKHKYEYGCNDSINVLIKLWQNLGSQRIEAYRKSKFMFVIMSSIQWVVSIFVLCWSLLKFDIFIYIFGETITNTRFELFLLKLFKKRIIFIYLGSDSRPPYIDGNYYDGSTGLKKILSRTKKIKKKIKLHEMYADAIINSPFSSHFNSKKVVNWFSIGFAKEVFPYQSFRKPDVVRILHAPSNYKVKGTKKIEILVNNLIDRGHNIEFIKIKGMPNKVVIEELEKCDFVVDQLYSDTPLAGLASEAASLGKPSVVGGYSAKSIVDICHRDDIPPSLYVCPDELETAIERLVIDHEYREKLGNDAYLFMKKRWSRELVAKRILRVISDEVPEEWLFNPKDIRYLEGAGVSRENSKVMTKAIIEQYGVQSLQLDDNHELQRAYMEYCGLYTEGS
ncbi:MULTISPECIES: glycosyltransferase [unclassified Endozoicomonas]|uniref:glycosyltransferase n=1 Tax=unclassified Endozoicomonas TaxID=2644528 RepID=UPI003BB4C20E